MQNFDELAEGYLGLVEKQKVSDGKAVDSFSRGEAVLQRADGLPEGALAALLQLLHRLCPADEARLHVAI